MRGAAPVFEGPVSATAGEGSSRGGNVAQSLRRLLREGSVGENLFPMRITLILSSLVLFTACSSPIGAESSVLYRGAARKPLDDALQISKTRVSEPIKGRATFHLAVPLPGRDALLLPFARESAAGLFGSRKNKGIGDWDHFSEGGSWRRSFQASESDALRATQTEEVRWHNAVLHDFSAGTEAVVLDQKGVLSRYWMRLDRGSVEELWRVTALLFGATVHDTNGDGVLDDEDAIALILMDGQEARLVTAPHTDLLHLAFDPTGNRALLYLALDEDLSGTFDINEGPIPFVLDLSGSGPAQALIKEQSMGVIDRALDSVD